MSTLDHTLKPEATAVRRLEVITGTGRRRQFSEDFKAGIIEETLVPSAVVSEVARRHGLAPQQVFTWRRQARQPAASEAEGPKFVPAVVGPASPARPSRGRRGHHVAGRANGHARWIGALAASRWRLTGSPCGSGMALKPRR